MRPIKRAQRSAEADRRTAAFYNVLFAGSGRLYHLVDGAVAFREKTLTENEGQVVDYLGLSVG
jgi:L-ascorbate metabolism protein UlaG (beta-lactamase superfamily)